MLIGLLKKNLITPCGIHVLLLLNCLCWKRFSFKKYVYMYMKDILCSAIEPLRNSSAYFVVLTKALFTFIHT
jgi:hypothetical protein